MFVFIIYKKIAVMRHLKAFLTIFLIHLTFINVVAIGIPQSYTTSIEGMAEYAKANGGTARERLLIIQQWMSENMVYDMEKYKQITSQSKALKSGAHQKATSLETLIKRKGVCEDFALLFAVIAREMGVDMFVVTGFSSRGGAHAWCASVIDNEPYLFDPTWASGSVNEETGEYFKKLNMDYFMVSPDKIHHIPVDPLWQFSEHPLKYHQTEIDKSVAEKESPYFNWRDTFETYIKMDTLHKAESTFKRGIRNGTPNADIASDLACFAMYITNIRFSNIRVELNNVINQIDSGSGRWGNDSKAKTAIQNVENLIEECENNMNSVKVIDDFYQKEINIYLKYISDLKREVSRCKTKLEKQKKEDDKRSSKRQSEMQFFNISQ